MSPYNWVIYPLSQPQVANPFPTHPTLTSSAMDKSVREKDLKFIRHLKFSNKLSKLPYCQCQQSLAENTQGLSQSTHAFLRIFIVHYKGTEVPLKNRHCLC